MQSSHPLQAKGRHLHTLEQTEFYRLLVNSIQDYAIFLLDPHGNVASWNLGAQKLKGYTPEEIIGKHFSTFYTPEDLEAHKPFKKLELCNKVGHVEDEGWRVRKDGTRFWANVVITTLHNASGERIGYAKITRDETVRKKHEDKLQEANNLLLRQQAELEALNASKDEFISLASHQLRTPASGVKQFLGLVLEGYAGELTDVQTNYLERANESNNRQIELVNSLLRVAQVDSGKTVLVCQPTDVNVLVRDVVDEQQSAFERREQTVRIKLPTEPLVAQVDSMRFRMVLENLIDNASKYTPIGGDITVRGGRNQRGMYISITDTGVGISADALPKLFQKFSRIPNELSETVGGSGLGLYWANQIVALHGGAIHIASTPGIGSTFEITIPTEVA